MNLKLTGLRVDVGGEGSRGGHIIGHTSGGKPIYSAHAGAARPPEHHERLSQAIKGHEDFGYFTQTPEREKVANEMVGHFSKAQISADIGKLKKNAVELMESKSKPDWHWGGIESFSKTAREHLKANEGGSTGGSTSAERIERGIKSGMVSGRMRHK